MNEATFRILQLMKALWITATVCAFLLKEDANIFFFKKKSKKVGEFLSDSSRADGQTDRQAGSQTGIT